MTEFMTWIQEVSGFAPDTQIRILKSVIIVFGLWAVRFGTLTVVWRRTEDPQLRYKWRKVVGYITLGMTLLLLIRLWFQGTQSLITVFGLIGAGLVIALQDLIKSLAGWGVIVWKRPFQVGERIQIGEHMGDVIDIRPLKFSMIEIGNWVDADQSTGRVIHMPNSKVLSDSVINYVQGFRFIWNEVQVMVTFESDWEKAKNSLMKIANEHSEHKLNDASKKIKDASKQFMVMYKTLTPTVYTSVKDYGVSLSIRYIVDPWHRRDSEQDIWEDILKEFAKHDDIDFAYPTQRFYDNRSEGKQHTGRSYEQVVLPIESPPEK